jgi:hypothetical protein
MAWTNEETMMNILSRWLAPAVLAAGLGTAALVPAPVHAQDDTLTRVLVDVADVVLRGGQPYYRYGNYGYNDRLIVQRDRYGRPVYYRLVPVAVRQGPPYGNAYGYWNNAPAARRVKCTRNGNCSVSYYDPQYDRRYYDRRYDDRYSRYDRHERHDRDRYWDGRRWRERDDD